MSRPARIENQHRHIGLDQQLAEGGAAHQLQVLLRFGVLEREIAVRTFARAGEHQCAQLTEDLQRRFCVRHVNVQAMPVEVNDVIRAALGLCRAQYLPQPLERRRAENVEFEQFPRALAQPFDQAAGDRAKRHVVAPTGAADDEQDSDFLFALPLQKRGLPRRFRMCADKLLRRERERGVGLWVAHQFPRNRGGLPHVVHHNLDARLVQLCAKRGPQVTRIVVGLKD